MENEEKKPVRNTGAFLRAGKSKTKKDFKAKSVKVGNSKKVRTTKNLTKNPAKEIKKLNSKKDKKTKYSEQIFKRSSKENLKIIPIGGIEEIGKNMTVFEYGNDIIIVDCGVAFPEDDMLGIDLVIPDFTYLEKNKEKIRGLVITHGHEDHIGSIPYFLKEINVPNESLIIIGLLHDICKVNYYKTDYRNAKNALGVWEKVPYYTVEDTIPYGHGEKSVMMLSEYIKLTNEEKYSIRWHMGYTEPKELYTTIGEAYKKYPIALLTHEADLEATYFYNI